MKTIRDKSGFWSLGQELLLFRPLSLPEKQSLWSMGDLLEYERLERIVNEGELSNHFYIVVEGTVQVQVNQQGTEVFICSLGPGATFGEAAMFLKMRRTADVVASDRALVLRLSREGLMEFFRHNPPGGNKILMVMVYGLLRKLRDSNQELAFERRSDVGQDDVDALVAELTGKS